MLTFAFCTYKRAHRLAALVRAMRAQVCPVPFELLAINNNSPDDTLQVLHGLVNEPGAPLHVVTETAQGIVHARNRAIEESLNSRILVFIDDDELPMPGLLQAVCHAVLEEGAECIGGRIDIDFTPHGRPRWLNEELEGFLGRLDHGPQALWVEDNSTPLWSGNIAYDTCLFRDDPGLRFDARYNRAGDGVGGGEDAMLFRRLLERGAKIRYRPDMAILHGVEAWRLERRYFINLHYQAGLRFGRYQLGDYSKKLFGIPPFLISQFLGQSLKALSSNLRGENNSVRLVMNAAHTLGTIAGYLKAQPRSASKRIT